MAIILHKICLVWMAVSSSMMVNKAINIPQAISVKNSSKKSMIRDSWKPIDWISISEIENIPPLDTISWQQLEQMPIYEASNFIEKICK